MVLIAASIFTKSGKLIMSRQFVEMTKARTEGLLAAFPKLITIGKQHTYIETDSVRYVYQPMDKLYMVLITTKASNILEDLETLRLFSKVIPEYCHSLEEKDIQENAFCLIFAFDEIVALGYRESVNLAQIKSYVEMDSHEEKLYQAVRQSQEREARQKMREKAKELHRQQMESNKRGNSIGSGVARSGGFSSEGFGSSGVTISTSNASPTIEGMRPATKAVTNPTSRNALKLGGKSKDVDSFVNQLKNEGEVIGSISRLSNQAVGAIGSGGKVKIAADIQVESVHLKIEDKLNVSLGRNSGVKQFELSGLLTLRISDEKFGRIKVQLKNDDKNNVQFQTHPNVDKELFKTQSIITLKNPSKPFPLNTDVGVLKWRLSTLDDTAVPLTVNCWPCENGEGGCDVNIEYELEAAHLELNDVIINIPLPANVQPSIAESDGTYDYDAHKHILQWQLPIINAENKSGSMEFSCNSCIPGDFFPLHISFASKTPYVPIGAITVQLVDTEETVKYSTENALVVEKYEID